MVASMNERAIVFPMANPTPEIAPDLALSAGAAVVGTGRSDFKNQINNVLAFPGIFRGALDARATGITEEMKLAAAYAIASLVSDEELSARRKEMPIKKKTDITGYLKRYAATVSSADKGAIINK
jgi:malate dehydrogenase (oxaloacetate-decarboxylating)